LHSKVESGSSRVVVTGFGPYSINLDVSAYVLTGELDEYFRIAEQLNFAVLEVLNANGSGIAFSSPPAFK